jgi:hypothetical protein
LSAGAMMSKGGPAVRALVEAGNIFIAPSFPLQGDQAVYAHAMRAPALPDSGGEGLVYRSMRLSKDDDRALLGLHEG